MSASDCIMLWLNIRSTQMWASSEGISSDFRPTIAPSFLSFLHAHRTRILQIDFQLMDDEF